MAYRSSGETRDLAIDPEEVLRAQRAQTRRRILGLGVAAVVVAGALGGIALFVSHRARVETREAWSRFVTCYVGSPPAPGELGARVRNTQLVAMSVPPEKRLSAADPPWPARCSGPAHAVAETIRKSGGTTPLADSVEKLAKVLAGDGNTTLDLLPLTDKVFAAATAAGLVATRASNVAEPPAHATPWTLATLPPAGRLLGQPLALSSVHAMPFGDLVTSFVADDKDCPAGPVVCTLEKGATDLACKKIPQPAAAFSPGLRPWGTAAPGKAPYVFAGDRGKSGIFRSDTGARVVTSLPYGAYGASVLGDGSFAYLSWDDRPPQIRLYRVEDGATRETKVAKREDTGNPYYSSAMFWGHVAYKMRRRGADGIRLVVRPLDAGGALGPEVDVGRLDEIGHIEGGSEEEPHLTACRAADTMVVRAKGWDNSYLSFLVGGRWTAPVESQGTRGLLQCRSGAASVTRVLGGPVGGRFKGSITQSRCTVSACDERDVDVAAMLARTDDIMPRALKDIRAIDVEGKVLVAWLAGDRGGLRLRIAAIEQLAAAEDRILVDDHVRDGAFQDVSTVVDFQLLPGPAGSGGAVLLVGMVDGVHAFFVDGSGKASPLGSAL